MGGLFLRRVAAYAVDALTYLAFPALFVPLGLYWRDTGVGTWTVVAVSAVPAAMAAAFAGWRESSAVRATWGKRALRLVVRPVAQPEGRLGRGPALLRNLIKVFLPWQLGHVVTLTGMAGGFERGSAVTFTALGLTYAMLIWLAVGSLLRPGRGPHDRASGAQVVRA